MIDETVSQTMEEVPYKLKVSILLKAFDHTQTNRRHLFSRSQSLYAWIGSVLLVIIGGSAIFGSSSMAIFGSNVQTGITVAICSLFFFAWGTEVLTFRALVDEGEAAVKIVRLLHLFEPGFFDQETIIFNESGWTDWMYHPVRRLGISPGTSVLFVLTIIAIATVWIQ